MLFVGAALPYDAKSVFLDTLPYPLGRNYTLRQVGIQQESSELITAEPRGRITAAQGSGYQKANFLDGLAARQVAEPVVHALKVVAVHHQHAEWAFLSPRPARLSP